MRRAPEVGAAKSERDGRKRVVSDLQELGTLGCQALDGGVGTP